ncbi:hypothetical protein LCGC14_2503350, partial [marine sediment metagenome]
VWPEMNLGPMGSQRADVLAISKSYRPQVIIYEIKQSRGDFKSDVTSGKYLGYLPCSTQLFFATPAGLIQKSEVPPEAGLITFKENKGWHVAKGASLRPLDKERFQEMLLPLLFRGHPESIRVRRLKERVVYNENAEIAPEIKRLGWDMARKLAAPDEAWEDIKAARATIEEIIGPVPNYSSLQGRARVWADKFERLDRVGQFLDLMEAARAWYTMGSQWVPEQLEVLAGKLREPSNGAGDLTESDYSRPRNYE